MKSVCHQQFSQNLFPLKISWFTLSGSNQNHIHVKVLGCDDFHATSCGTWAGLKTRVYDPSLLLSPNVSSISTGRAHLTKGCTSSMHELCPAPRWRFSFWDSSVHSCVGFQWLSCVRLQFPTVTSVSAVVPGSLDTSRTSLLPFLVLYCVVLLLSAVLDVGVTVCSCASQAHRCVMCLYSCLQFLSAVVCPC